jgi:regulator of protease activity HflC (stomatin/prohibitin superfamily)
MSQPPREPDHLLASLLSPEEQAEAQEPADDDVDTLIDELESLVARGRRMPLHKLLIDEDDLLQIVDRLRTAIPAEVKQAHAVLDEHDRILESARSKARALMDERGISAEIESQRQAALAEAERDADRIRAEADRYAQRVLADLEERLNKVLTSVRNGIETLRSGDSPGT